MLVIIVSSFFWITLTHAQHPSLGHLNPILYQENIQSPSGRYKYGYGTNNARAHQVHDSDDTSRGFYSYLDDQGKVQHVDYIAGSNGYQVVENSDIPNLGRYTPEVGAARTAQLAAYLAARRQPLMQQKTSVNVRSSFSKNVKRADDTPLTVNIPLTYESKPRNYISTHPTTFGDGNINLFSGQPLNSVHRQHYLRSPTISVFQTTTPNPTTDYTATNLENKVYVLPSPTVDHYEKIWPLPPIRFKDLEVRVNGQDWYDPRPRYSDRNVDYTPQLTRISQNPFNAQQATPQGFNFQTLPAGSEINQVHSTNRDPAFKTDYFSQPTTTGVSVHPPEFKLESRNTFGTQQTNLQAPDFHDSFAGQLSQSFENTNTDAVVNRVSFGQPKTFGLTAHQVALMNYKQGLLANNNMDITNQYSGVNDFSTNISANLRGPVTKVVVRKSHVDSEKNIAALAAKKAFDVFKSKYNFS